MISEEAVLFYIENEKDKDGFPVQRKKEFGVYVREKSVGRTEFYKALRSGTTVNITFDVRIEDWERTRHKTENNKIAYAQKVLYDGAEYDIIRTYRPDRSMIQLVCA